MKQLLFRFQSSLVQCRSLAGVPLPPDDGVLSQSAIATEEREVRSGLRNTGIYSGTPVDTLGTW